MSGLFFKKNEVKNLTDLKAGHEGLYEELMEEARGSLNQSSTDETDTRSKREIELEAQVGALELSASNKAEDEKIISYATKLKVKVPKLAEGTERMSFNDALLIMVDSSTKKEENIGDAFAATASNAAGTSLEQGDETEPETFIAAMRMVAERDKLSMVDARKKASLEFKELFNKQYNSNEEGE
jgi:hypothetical protein